MPFSVETLENLTDLLLELHPERSRFVCRHDAAVTMSVLATAGLLVSEKCGVTVEQYGFLVRRGEGKWSPVYEAGHEPALAERIAMTTCRFGETYQLAVRTVHQGPWREANNDAAPIGPRRPRRTS
jgi:hypothetical protein